MIILKVIGLFACTLVTVQSTAKNAQEDVQSAIDQQALAIKEAEQNNVNINEALHVFVNNSDAMSISMWKLIGNRYSDLKQTIQKAENEAEEHGANVSDCSVLCINNTEWDMKKIDDIVSKWLGQFVDKHAEIFDEILDKIQMATTTLEAFKLDAWACDNDTCLERVLEQVNQFAAVTSELSQTAKSELKDITDDSNVVLYDCLRKLNELFSIIYFHEVDFKECVSDKLGN